MERIGRDGDAGAGIEGRYAGAAGADALGQRALRIELELAGQILLLEQLPDLPGSPSAALDCRGSCLL
jgi:hypothetical protein